MQRTPDLMINESRAIWGRLWSWPNTQPLFLWRGFRRRCFFAAQSLGSQVMVVDAGGCEMVSRWPV